MIGDDIDAVCKQAAARHGLPVVPVHAPGFVGSKNLGSRLGGEAVLAHLIGTLEPEITTAFDINLIGDYNVTGDMWQYTPLLEELGIRVLSTLSGDGRVAAIRTAHRAKLNVLVCAKSLISLTRKMEERYGIPSISLSFYGKRDTSAGLLAIAEALGDADLVERTQAADRARGGGTGCEARPLPGAVSPARRRSSTPAATRPGRSPRRCRTWGSRWWPRRSASRPRTTRRRPESISVPREY